MQNEDISYSRFLSLQIVGIVVSDSVASPALHGRSLLPHMPLILVQGIAQLDPIKVACCTTQPYPEGMCIKRKAIYSSSLMYNGQLVHQRTSFIFSGWTPSQSGMAFESLTLCPC